VNDTSANLLQIDTTVADPPVYVRVRMRRVIEGDASWLGKLFYIEDGLSADEAKRQFAPEPDWSKGWVTVVWDMTTPDAGSWIGLPDIARLRFDFVTDTLSVSTVFDIASIIVDKGNNWHTSQVLPLPFALHNTGDFLLTALAPLTQIQTPLILDTDYSVTVGTAPSFTLLSALSNGKDLVARRLSSPRNELSLTGTTLPIPETEETFDRFANYHADLLGELDRCVKLSDGEPTPSSQGKIPIPEDRKGNFLKYDDTTGDLTHSPKLDGVPGPQGVQGDGARVLFSYGDTGGFPLVDSSFSLVGTAPISTSRSGDTITIASANIAGIDMLTADVGGTTMGSVITLAGAALTDVTRSVDTITINSTSAAAHATGSVPNPALDFSTERNLLSIDTVSGVTTYEAEVVDWPSTYRSIEVEFLSVIPTVDTFLRGYLWDATNSLVLSDELHHFECNSFELLNGGLFTGGSGRTNLGFLNHDPFFGNLYVELAGLGSNGPNGSIKITHVDNQMVFGKLRSQYIQQFPPSSDNRVTMEYSFAQQTPLSAGITHDGILIELYRMLVPPITQQPFSGSFKIWGYPL